MGPVDGDRTPPERGARRRTTVAEAAELLGISAEARRIIAGLVERIPAIEAHGEAEASDTSETVEQEPDRAEPRPDAPGRQEGARRPWWRRVRRVFGG
jgi:hypothetical protein